MGMSVLRSTRAWARKPATLRRWALAAVIVNVGLVVTGGAVRLTASGLGCPTWPSCTTGSLTPTSEYAAHGKIEFTNRLLVSVVSVVVLVTLLVAIVRRRHVTLAALLTASIPAQAVLGGISVLTKLNPWVVAFHFLLSILILTVAFALWWRARAVEDAQHGARPPLPSPPTVRAAGWIMLAVTTAVLLVGSVVTGSGPHSGATDAAHRMHFSPSSVAQLHADLVMLLIGVTVGFVVLAGVAGACAELRRAGYGLLGVELAQGVIGYLQYFTHVPAVLVEIHMLGACLVWLAALTVLARTSTSSFRDEAPVVPALAAPAPLNVIVSAAERH